MNIDLLTIIALAFALFGVYCRNCVLNDRCDNLEAENDALHAENERLRQLQTKYLDSAEHLIECMNELESENVALQQQLQFERVGRLQWRVN